MTGLTAKLFHRSPSKSPVRGDLLPNNDVPPPAYKEKELNTDISEDSHGDSGIASRGISREPALVFSVAHPSNEKGLQIWTPTLQSTTSTHAPPPTYSIRVSNSSRLIELWRGTDITTQPIATAHLSSGCKTAEIHLANGQTFHTSTSQMTGATKSTHPALGPLKWKTSMTTGLASELRRDGGDKATLAKFVAIKWSRKGPKELQLMVDGLDEETLQFLVLYGRAARLGSQKLMEAVALAGAVS